MWVSKKKWKTLAKRLADLEVQVQGQQMATAILSEKELKYFKELSENQALKLFRQLHKNDTGE